MNQQLTLELISKLINIDHPLKDVKYEIRATGRYGNYKR